MAYSTGTYTGVNDALNKLAAWAVTNGWTQNDLSDDSEKYAGDTFTGRRAHLYKSINGLDVYMNLRSCENQRVWEYSGPYVTGICINGSTAYIGGTHWDKQTNHTNHYGSTSSICGCVDDIITTGGTYHFFATGTNITAVFETDSTYSDWRILSFGRIGSVPYYAASGGHRYVNETTSYDARSSFLISSYSAGDTGNWSFWDGTRWYRSYLYRYYGAEYVATAPIDSYGISDALTDYSPDSFRGNVQLAPIIQFTTKSLAFEQYHVGEYEGIKAVNMTNHSEGDEIVYGGGDTYKLFSIFRNSGNKGVALLK